AARTTILVASLRVEGNQTYLVFREGMPTADGIHVRYTNGAPSNTSGEVKPDNKGPRFELGIGTGQLERQRLVSHIHKAGVELWGVRWTSLDYLEDYLDLLKKSDAKPGAKPRRVVLIPWQLIPLTYFVWWPVIPLIADSFILVLPPRASFQVLAALDVA